MSVLLYGDLLTPSVSKIIAGGKPAKVVAPYWGSHAYKALGIPAKGSLEGRLDVMLNVLAESTDLDVVEDMINRGANVWARSDLHAKAYFNDREAVVGSANASGRAFGVAKCAALEELCVHLKGPAVIKELDDWWSMLEDEAVELIKGSRTTRDVLANARYAKASKAKAIDLEAALLSGKVPFDRAFLTVDWIAYSKKLEDRLREMSQREVGLDYDAWVDWDEMPTSSSIISYTASKKGDPIKFDSIWLTPPELIPEDGAVYVTRLRDVAGYKLTPSDGWDRAVELYYEVIQSSKKSGFPRGQADGSGGCISLEDFATYLRAVRC